MECNLELGLLPSSSMSLSPSTTASTISMGSNGENSRQERQMTIFYNGRVCVCDVTELQARNIISLASKKTEEGMMRRSSLTGGLDPMLSPTLLQSQKLCSQNGNLTMKRSLRQFLEKRKHRVQSASPYHR